jgi:hypothetical protein
MVSTGDNQKLLDGLVAAERCSQVLAAALLDGQPDSLATAAADMQQATTALSGALQLAQRGGNIGRSLQQRLHRLGQELALQREACLRRSAFVDRALNSIIPSSRSTTYSGSAGSGLSPYGKQARSSGAFGRISA